MTPPDESNPVTPTDPKVETRSARVVTYLPDGTEQEAFCAPDDYVIVTGPLRYVHYIQRSANGTVVITLKLDREADRDC